MEQWSPIVGVSTFREVIDKSETFLASLVLSHSGDPFSIKPYILRRAADAGSTSAMVRK